MGFNIGEIEDSIEEEKKIDIEEEATEEAPEDDIEEAEEAEPTEDKEGEESDAEEVEGDEEELAAEEASANDESEDDKPPARLRIENKKLKEERERERAEFEDMKLKMAWLEKNAQQPKEEEQPAVAPEEMTQREQADFMMLSPKEQADYIADIFSSTAKPLQDKVNQYEEERAFNQYKAAWRNQEAAIVESDPEYAQAAEHLRNAERLAIKSQNPFATPDVIEAELERREIMGIDGLVSKGIDPFVAVKNTARSNGFTYAPEPEPETTPKPNLNEVRGKKKQAQNIIGATTRGKHNHHSKEEILNMPLDEMLELDSKDWVAAYND